MWVEPTGSAVEMYSCTTALRIAVFRSSSMVLLQVIDGALSAGTHSPRALGPVAADPSCSDHLGVDGLDSETVDNQIEVGRSRAAPARLPLSRRASRR